MKFNYSSNSSLPHNRFEQIKDVLHYHLFEVMAASIYTFLFTLPAIVWIIFSGLLSLFEGNYFLNVVAIYAILIPLIGIMGLGYAGGLYFFKRLLFNEGANINRDFIVGVRKNGKCLFKIFLLLGLIYFFLHTGASLIDNLNVQVEIKMVLLGLSYTLFFLLLITLLFMATQTILYQASFIQLFCNGLRFCFGYLHKNILILILVILPFLTFEFSLLSEIKWISILISMGFYFGFGQAVFTSFSYHVFDLTINKKQFQEYIRKGLSKNETDNI